MKARPSARGALGLLAAVAMWMSAAAGVGCGPGFDPYNRLNSPRVLAIQSEPVAPAPGETSTLSAKTYTPNGIALTYDWSWCPVTPAVGTPCPYTDDDLTALAGVPVTLHLGNTKTVPFQHNIPADLLQMLCNGMPGFPMPDCTGGFPIQVRVAVCTDSDPAGCTTTKTAVEAVRGMRLRLHPADATDANANPTITGLHALIAGMDTPADLTATPSPTLVRKKELVITADIHPEQDAEVYLGHDDAGLVAMVPERLTLSWFVESGDTNHQRTSYIQGTTASGDASDRVKWTPAYLKDEKDAVRTDLSMSRVIVIIRDDRDGTAWIDGNAQLVEGATP
jgi:hypothetical protein